ncbi:hypothetical protein LIER_24299 [Lithospermum erythrorhizon]|uniref:Uncharacterized protein n=1 Tax=Lithospermum erythrorhizon TaxID=34254 RepID=A0AAV3R3M8_LITER
MLGHRTHLRLTNQRLSRFLPRISSEDFRSLLLWSRHFGSLAGGKLEDGGSLANLFSIEGILVRGMVVGGMPKAVAGGTTGVVHGSWTPLASSW